MITYPSRSVHNYRAENITQLSFRVTIALLVASSSLSSSYGSPPSFYLSSFSWYRGDEAVKLSRIKSNQVRIMPSQVRIMRNTNEVVCRSTLRLLGSVAVENEITVQACKPRRLKKKICMLCRPIQLFRFDHDYVLLLTITIEVNIKK